MLKPGDDVDSWCGVCKSILAHTIEAMVGESPARVHCNTCGAQHKYRPNKPGTKKARKTKVAGSPRARTTRATSYQKLLEGKDLALAKRYSFHDRYAADDVLSHPKFGIGVTTTVKDSNKIEVVFEDGVKTLIHGR